MSCGYWLLAIGYWLVAIVYWLLAIGYWLLAIGYWLLAIGVNLAKSFTFRTSDFFPANCRTIRTYKSHTQQTTSTPVESPLPKNRGRGVHSVRPRLQATPFLCALCVSAISFFQELS